MISLNRRQILTLLFILTIASFAFICGTFARYSSVTAGKSTITAAKWSILVNNVDITKSGNENFEFDLFDELIAPGSSGQYSFDIYNDSDVNAKYTIEFIETNVSNIPIQYSLDGIAWADSMESLNKSSISNVSLIMQTNSSKTLYWRWLEDSENSFLESTSITVSATVTVTQVN